MCKIIFTVVSYSLNVDDEELLNKSGNELARKEMGLEWMLKSTSRNESSCAQREEEPEQPEKPIEEVKLFVFLRIREKIQ